MTTCRKCGTDLVADSAGDTYCPLLCVTRRDCMTCVVMVIIAVVIIADMLGRFS